MTKIEILKNTLVNRILLTKNEKLLNAINNIFESTQPNDVLNLSSKQIEMMKMSDSDIKADKFVSEKEIEFNDLEWMK